MYVENASFVNSLGKEGLSKDRYENTYLGRVAKLP